MELPLRNEYLSLKTAFSKPNQTCCSFLMRSGRVGVDIGWHSLSLPDRGDSDIYRSDVSSTRADHRRERWRRGRVWRALIRSTFWA